MNLSRRQVNGLAIVVLLAWIVVHGRVRAAHPGGVATPYVDAIGLSVLAPAFVLFVAYLTPPFRYRRYVRTRGRRGIALDAVLIALGCGLVAGATAFLIVELSLPGSTGFVLLLAAAYAASFAVFATRNSTFYGRSGSVG